MVTDTPANDGTAVTPAEEPKSFLEQAQEALGDAFESTVEAVKEHPVAAAAIAAGAAAAVAGAAYGISQLLDSDDDGKK
ncbi:MAG: hypothetical protein V4574_17660 [Pseudomonadota bacterium]